jgi:purine-binding chemotaxis protein CheW
MSGRGRPTIASGGKPTSGKGHEPTSGKDSEEDEKAGVRKKLPASGLASDLLQSPDAGPAEREPVPAGAEQIYAFADSLEAQEPVEEGPRREMETWVTFRLEGETFSFPVSHVQEILRVETITRVPHAPKAVRGVTNMRGRVLPVVDLRVRLGLPEALVTEESKILVAASKGRLLGLLVDSMRQVVHLDRLRVQPPPADVMTEQSDYILGVCDLEGELVILLDVDRVLLIKE